MLRMHILERQADAFIWDLQRVTIIQAEEYSRQQTRMRVHMDLRAR